MAKADTLKQDLLHVCEALEKRYGRRKPMAHDDFIEALVFQILELGAPERSAKDALARIKDEYVDWNDMRVATVREIQDILGSKYVRCREKAEDLHSLLADLYTAFRRMDIREALAGDGIETLRALPETSNIRRDFVDRALLLALGLKVFPCDEEQLRLLKLLGGCPKPWTLQQAQKRIEETLDVEGLDRLSRCLREHVQMYQEAGQDEPQIIAFSWDKPDPLGMDKARKADKPKTGKVEKPKADKPEKKAEKPKADKPEKKAEKPKTGKTARAEKKPEKKPAKK